MKQTQYLYSTKGLKELLILFIRSLTLVANSNANVANTNRRRT